MQKIVLGLTAMMMSMMMLSGCAAVSKITKPAEPPLEAQLKVSGANSQLKAKLILTNKSTREMVIDDLDSRFFKVQTLDNKPMDPKVASSKPLAPIRIKPGQTVETAFDLHPNYSFWDRLTRYKIQYDAPELKSNVVQVWF